jgi:hypothetical protein
MYHTLKLKLVTLPYLTYLTPYLMYVHTVLIFWYLLTTLLGIIFLRYVTYLVTLSTRRSYAMLPYRLRQPTYGKKLSNLRDSKDGQMVFNKGGPVQVAIETDLIIHRQTFLKAWRESSLCECTGMGSEVQTSGRRRIKNSNIGGQDGIHKNHQNFSGRAFSLFKQIFAASKIDLLHHFVPPKCDREAYSQLIYASCFSLLKQSKCFADISMDEGDHGNDSVTSPVGIECTNKDFEAACHALFSLYTLYETNPLPEGVDNSRQLFPVGLSSAENSKLFYRRAFRQKIRIDRFHYQILLRLKSYARKQLAQCQWLSDQSKWIGYSLSADALEIVNRLLPKLVASEYTGPVGVEALAGGAAYPYPPPAYDAAAQELEDSKKELEERWNVETRESSTSIAFDDLNKSLERYQNTLGDIQIPAKVGRAAIKTTMGRIRSTLEPLFTVSTNWSQVRTQMSQVGNDEGSKTKESIDDRSVVRIIPAKSKESASDRKRGELSSGFLSARNTNIIQSIDIPPELRGALETCFEKLYQRGGTIMSDLPPVDPTSQAEKHSDDVSSIGQGGVSVTARMPQLQAPDKGANATIPRVASLPKRQAGSRLTTGNSFLSFAADKTGDTDIIVGKEVNLSDMSDVSDGGHMEDEISVATSAAGKTAMKKLLSAVNRPRKRRLQLSSQDTSNKDPASSDISVDREKPACHILLSNTSGKQSSSHVNTNESPAVVLSPKRKGNADTQISPKMKRQRAQAHTPEANFDTDSLASSFGGGKDALQTLLTLVPPRPNGRVKKTGRRKG